MSVFDIGNDSNFNERFIQNVGTVIKGILVLITLVCLFIIYNIVRTNVTIGEEELGTEKTAGEIRNTGMEIMRMAGNTFLLACKVAVPVSLALNFFFRFNKFRLVITGYWAGALIMPGDCFIMIYIAVKSTIHK